MTPPLPDHDAFARLLAARHACILVQTMEEEYVLKLLGEVAMEAGLDLWLWSITGGLRDGLVDGSPPTADTDHPAAALYLIGQGTPNGSKPTDRQTVYVLLDVVGHLKDERTLRTLREAIEYCRRSGNTLVLVDHHAEMPPVVTSLATRFEPSLPDEVELEHIVKSTLRKLHDSGQGIELAVSRDDLAAFVRNLRGLSRRQARQVVMDAVSDDRRFDHADIDRVLGAKRRAVGDGILEYIEAPVSLDEIGGLTKLKAWLKRRQCCERDDARAFGLIPPRGVLMLGVQGAGKSLSAKAVATAWRRPLLRLDAGTLYDRYVGESEHRLRDALAQAQRMAPVVLWIDEIEKGFASAASMSSDGGLSKRMFGTLLTWMQERDAERGASVFLIATANDIEALPPELLRKGRFDEIFFVDLPALEARSDIFAIHLAKRKRNPKAFDLAALAEATDGFSGAEIEQAIVAALHDAFDEGTELTSGHILAAAKASPPLSVTMAERIAGLRAWAQGRCVPAD